LLAGVIAALALANISPATYQALLHWSPLGHGSPVTLHFLVNDVFMALFFAIAAAEITESCLPGGALNPLRKAVNPLLGTLGGVLGPIAVYFTWMALSGDWTIRRGWGIPTATDIAIAWLVARIAFGARHPAVSFLLLLAVADDGIGLGIIAVFYPDPARPVRPEFLLITAAAMAIAYGLRRRDTQPFWAYLLGPGVLSWVGLHLTGVHPALALVPVVPFMPSMDEDLGLFDEREQAATDTLNRFEHVFKVPVDVGLFVFGLVNAGVGFSSISNATFAVLVALVVGKPLGISLFSAAAHRAGFPLPTGMGPRTLFLAGLTAGLGLTVALFVAGVAFADPELQGGAKMGALLSAGLAPVVVLLARVSGVRDAAGLAEPADATSAYKNYGESNNYGESDEQRHVATL
jgi:Na+:H+ antiporter, NhaA family